MLGTVAAAGMVHWGLAKIDRSMVAGLTSNSAAAAEVEAQEGPQLLNVLVVGSDSREGLSDEEIRAFGTGRSEGNRTDTLMLVQLEVGGDGRGAILSFPRDLLVERCDGTQGRINAAYGIGVERDGDGPTCLVETVASATGLEIHHYVEVSFAGFLKVVDAIGGVGLYLDEPLADEKAHINLPAGCVELRGPDALGFVRARHVDNDFGRIARQQRFIKETIREATDLGVLANPARLYAVVEAAASAVRTDDQLDVATMREIAEGMRRLTAEGLQVHTVPSEATFRNGVWYVVEHPRKADELYRSFRNGSVLETVEPTEAATPSLPSVTVLNASGEDGLAATAGELVEAEGFGLAEVGNAETADLERTRILHPPELEEAAARLAEVFPGADVIQGVAGLPLTVKLGADLHAAELSARLDRAAPDGQAGASERSSAEESEEAQPAEPTYRGAKMTDVDC